MNATWKKSYIVTGMGGVRTDFVTAWLHFHKDFHRLNYDWNICKHTGSTLFYQQNPFSSLDDFSTESLLKNYQVDSDRNLAFKSHILTYQKWKDILIPTLADKTILVAISTSTTNEEQWKLLNWEFICKTFLSQSKTKNTLIQVGKDFEIENFDTDHPEFHDILTAYLKLRVKQYTPGTPPVAGEGLNCCYLDYTQLIEPTGAEHVTDVLGLSIDPVANEKWRRMLAQSFAPSEIAFHGKVYSYDSLTM